MGAKIASFLATLLLSIPLAAIGIMAVFGVPQLVPASNTAERNQVLRGFQDALNWGRGNNGGDQVQPAYEEDAAPFVQNAAPMHQNSMQNSETPNQVPNWSSGSANQGDARSMAVRRDSSTLSNTSSLPNGIGNGNGNGVNGRTPPSHWSNPQTTPAGDATRVALNQSNGFAANNMAAANGNMSVNSGANVPVASVSTPFNSSETLTWRQASQRLSDLGVTNFHLERGDKEGTFLFVCLYSPGDAPQVTHRFEAQADDPLMAVNQVLQQVDSWMQERFAKANFPNRSPNFSLNAGAQSSR
ncbi:hypothetical protein [Planctomicrobium sp. SH527]|uniref:hypothetical protein n=1 Tax=Planctomicrobium sp. SH527 TaxID=3448123 RepID=UPI003F5BB068